MFNTKPNPKFSKLCMTMSSVVFMIMLQTGSAITASVVRITKLHGGGRDLGKKGEKENNQTILHIHVCEGDRSIHHSYIDNHA